MDRSSKLINRIRLQITELSIAMVKLTVFLGHFIHHFGELSVAAEWWINLICNSSFFHFVSLCIELICKFDCDHTKLRVAIVWSGVGESEFMHVGINYVWAFERFHFLSSRAPIAIALDDCLSTWVQQDYAINYAIQIDLNMTRCAIFHGFCF